MAQNPGPSRTPPPALMSTSKKRAEYCPRCAAWCPQKQQGAEAGDETMLQCRSCKSYYRRGERRAKELEDWKKLSRHADRI